MTEWKWFTGFAPSIGWDVAFQAREDLLNVLDCKDAPASFRIRRPSQLGIGKDKEMHLARWMPGAFRAVDKESVGLVARNLFTWILEATPAAAEDWDKEWEPTSGLVVDDPQMTVEAAAEEARAKAALVKQLKSPAKQPEPRVR